MKSIILSTLPAIIFAGIVLLIYILYARLCLIWAIRKIRKKPTGKILSNRLAICLHSVAWIGFACMAYAYFIEPYWLEINTVTLQTEKLASTTFRIVQISDTHCSKRARLEERIVDIINELNPDVIVFTGDAIVNKKAVELFQETMQKLDAPLGKFAVKGNWDCWYWSDLDLFDNTGFDELKMHERTVEKNGESISIAGLAYKNDLNPQELFGKLQADNFNLLLYHTPVLMDYVNGSNVDLYLCGHTHGGQIAIPFYGALTTLSKHGKKYEAGLYQEGSTQLYVNRGIGLEGGHAPPMRFFSRPEITVFDIVPKEFEVTKVPTQTPEESNL